MIKQIHNLVQGTQEWLDFRINHNGASEAAVMLGISPFAKRDELLQIKKTGLPKEFSDFVEKVIFAEGHRVEPLAREMLERYIEDDLYPVVYSLGKMSASCDGITMDEAIAFECKQFNQSLFDGVKTGVIPEYYMAQCQQVLMVTGANSIYFTVSDGTEANTAWVGIDPDNAWFDRIKNGWEQFDIDLESFVVVEPVAEVVAEAIPQLPALSVITRGEVVQSNLPQFKQAAIGFIKSVNTDLQTDQDFVNAKAFVKFAQDGEERLEAQKSAILAQTSDIELAIRTIDDVKAELRSKRLEIDKLVKTREQSIKIEIKLAGESDWLKHKTDLQSNIKGIQLIVQDPDLASAMKNKRTIDSLRNAVNTEVANAKIQATQIARNINEKLKFMADNAVEYSFLFNDLQTIIYKPLDDLQLIISTRIEQHKKAEAERLEQERLRIAAEEKAKAECEAAEKLRVEQEKIQREANEKLKAEQAELERVNREERLRILKESQEAKEAFAAAAEEKLFAKQNENQKIEADTSKLFIDESPSLPSDRTIIIRLVREYFDLVDQEAEALLIKEFGRKS